MRMHLLYKQVMRAHRAHLPAPMRKLGDSYARDEFRRHRGAQEEHLTPFFREWRGYLDTIQGTGGAAGDGTGQFGKDLDRDTLDSLTEEQQQNLAKLEAEAKGRTDS